MHDLMVWGVDRPIGGEVALSGAKNAALKALAAAPLAQTPLTLDNMPLLLSDVTSMIQTLESLGADISRPSDRCIRIAWPSGTPSTDVPIALGKMRTSLLLLGSLAARCGYARTPIPHGFNTGMRCYEFYISPLRQLGIDCREEAGYLIAESRGLRPANLEFPLRTTAGTENSLLAAAMAPGRTRIVNAHTSPETDDLIALLNLMGGHVRKLGSGLIEVEGVEKLHGAQHSIIYDRIEAVTYMCFVAATRGRALIRKCPRHHLGVPTLFLRESGVRFELHSDGLIVDGTSMITPFDFTTGTYPGIHSDTQPFFAALATQAEGPSYITDCRHSHRFQYVAGLKKLGADVTVQKNTIVVRGPSRLTAAPVSATDLRGGAALIGAALVADGVTTIEHAERITRGYDHLQEKLSRLGVMTELHDRKGELADVA